MMDISPRWSTTAKAIVMVAILAVLGYLLVRFQLVVTPLIMAVILAYLFNPLAARMTQRLRMSRTLAVLLIYGVLLLLFLGLLSGAGLLIQQQFSGVLSTALTFINSIPEWLASLSAQPVHIGPFTFNLSATDITALQNALIPTARDWIGRLTDWMTTAASSVAIFLAWSMFVFIISYYLLNDLYALEGTLLRVTPPDFRKDIERLLTELGPIWNAFLRGQMLLSLIMGTAVGLTMSALGVRYSIILGLIAALMEFIPIVGPYVTTGTAIIIALFQTENWLGLPPATYTIVVAAAALLLQQIEANVLGPRIMSRHLRLNPAALIIAAFIGASLAGIPGLLLAGPMLATLRLIGRYFYAKLFDLPPWPDLEEHQPVSVRENAIRCRPARAEDKTAVLALTARIWEGHDYVPRVWDEWLADTQGVLAVAELEGTVVGLGKLTNLGASEWWLEGIRVLPRYQGQKIGSRIFEYLMNEWRRKDGEVIRLATSSERMQIHRICNRLGFKRLAALPVMSAPSLPSGEAAFEPMTAADAEAAIALAGSGSIAWGIPGLMNTGWQWSRLSAARVEEFARCGRAWWWGNRSAALLLYDYDDDGKPDVEIAALIAPQDRLEDLLRQARVLAGRLGASQLGWTGPNTAAALDAAERAGFIPEWDAKFWIFERPANPAP
jgi:predicted PurR-regulated permease PerM/GNAT superfamily N-acetyltransferase